MDITVRPLGGMPAKVLLNKVVVALKRGARAPGGLQWSLGDARGRWHCIPPCALRLRETTAAKPLSPVVVLCELRFAGRCRSRADPPAVGLSSAPHSDCSAIRIVAIEPEILVVTHRLLLRPRSTPGELRRSMEWGRAIVSCNSGIGVFGGRSGACREACRARYRECGLSQRHPLLNPRIPRVKGYERANDV
jgi:hypothetical protein